MEDKDRDPEEFTAAFTAPPRDYWNNFTVNLGHQGKLLGKREHDP